MEQQYSEKYMEYIPHFIDELIEILTDLHINDRKNQNEVKDDE